ncbi:MAG TPA: OsmC family protein [Thermoanaerobaculia bacterium]|nr:OsmC family protein [Thermoanaerobaculia bacterium]
MRSEALRIPDANGAERGAALDLPLGAPLGWCLFAHAGLSDGSTERLLSGALVGKGIAVLRLALRPESPLPEAIEEVLAAADFLRQSRGVPRLLAGHGLGGAAVLGAGPGIPDEAAVAVLACPAGEIQEAALASLDRPLLFLHSPVDEKVPIEAASRLFAAARHPKSFLSLGKADHLLSAPEAARAAGEMLAAWAVPQLAPTAPEAIGVPPGEVLLGGDGHHLVQEIVAGHHWLAADEPLSVAGGTDQGPNPYELLLAALGACTSMTLQLYAARKKLPLEGVRVRLRHSRIHAADCAACQTQEGLLTRLEREIELDGPLSPEERDLLLGIADRCPVHRTLASEIDVVTRLVQARTV